MLKKEFIGPGLHLRPVHADHAQPPFQWALNSVFSAYENNNRKIKPPPDRGILKIISRFSSVAQLCPTLRPHELQHARPPCPLPKNIH